MARSVVSTLYRLGLRGMMMQAPKALNSHARHRFHGAHHPGARGSGRGDGARIGTGEVRVVPMDGEGRTAFMSDIITTHLLAKGSADVVLDGGVSDAVSISDIPLPVFCCGTTGTPVPSHRLVVELKVPIIYDVVPILAGDVIMGDANGMVRIPAHLMAQVAATAVERETFEEWVITEALKGRPLTGLHPANEATKREYEAHLAATKPSV